MFALTILLLPRGICASRLRLLETTVTTLLLLLFAVASTTTTDADRLLQPWSATDICLQLQLIIGDDIRPHRQLITGDDILLFPLLLRLKLRTVDMVGRPYFLLHHMIATTSVQASATLLLDILRRQGADLVLPRDLRVKNSTGPYLVITRSIVEDHLPLATITLPVYPVRNWLLPDTDAAPKARLLVRLVLTIKRMLAVISLAMAILN